MYLHKKKFISIFFTVIIIFSAILTFTTVVAIATELPYVADVLFSPGTINSRNLVTSNGTDLFISDSVPDNIYKVDIATGEYEKYCNLADLSISYNNKSWYISYASDMFYNHQNNSLMLTSCTLKRDNALSGTTETLSGYYTVDVTNKVVRYKNNRYVMGVFPNGDILENSGYSGTTMTAKRLKYPNYSSTVNTYSYYNVDEYSSELGIVNIDGTDYLLNSEGIYPATGGSPRFLTYGNLIGANSDYFFMIRDSVVLKLTSGGSVVDQFSLDDVEILDGGDIYNSKRNPLLVTDDEEIIFLDTDWNDIRKISKRKVPVTGISLNKTCIALRKGTYEALTATVTPSNATNQKIVWTSSNNNIATVENGIVTFINKGIATITATTSDGNYIAQCSLACFDFEDDFINYGFDSNGIAWAISNSGVFTMMGTGDTENYAKVSDIPWYSNRLNVTHIIIDNEITGIGDRCFYGCINTQKAEIPPSVLTIGAYTFANCDDMTIYGKSGTYAETYANSNNILFIDVNKDELKNITVDFAQTSTRWYFDVSVSDFTDEAVVYIAIYDSQRKMLSKNTANLVINDITSISLPQNVQADFAKVFVWKSNTLQPVTSACTVNLN